MTRRRQPVIQNQHNGLAMEAEKTTLEFVVLDRPNPVGGLKIEGNLVEDNYIFFVSQFKIPYLYGLTCGELALMLNGEKMLNKQCKLHIVKNEEMETRYGLFANRFTMDSIPHRISPPSFRYILSC